MNKIIDKSLFDWQRGQSIGIQSRGVASLVVAYIKDSSTILNVSGGKTRCVWPANLKAMDSRYLSRRINSIK